MYYCFNVVTQPAGVAEAVLIRALEPLDGIPFMEEHRQITDRYRLCCGPGCLTQAMGIMREHNGQNIINGPLRIESSTTSRLSPIVTTPRVGIAQPSAQDSLLRYYEAGNPYVSGHR